jgi:hypothetical protein
MSDLAAKDYDNIIIRPMLIARNIWQNSRAVLLRRKNGAAKNGSFFRHHIFIIIIRQKNKEETIHEYVS